MPPPQTEQGQPSNTNLMMDSMSCMIEDYPTGRDEKLTNRHKSSEYVQIYKMTTLERKDRVKRKRQLKSLTKDKKFSEDWRLNKVSISSGLPLPAKKSNSRGLSRSNTISSKAKLSK